MEKIWWLRSRIPALILNCWKKMTIDCSNKRIHGKTRNGNFINCTKRKENSQNCKRYDNLKWLDQIRFASVQSCDISKTKCWKNHIDLQSINAVKFIVNIIARLPLMRNHIKNFVKTAQIVTNTPSRLKILTINAKKEDRDREFQRTGSTKKKESGNVYSHCRCWFRLA